MALAARLIETLAVVGSRKADGTVNASGLVFLYEPGTTVAVSGYTSEDCSEVWTLQDGGIPLDVAGKAEIWVREAVDVRIEDSDGAELATLADFNKVGAAMVEVVNDNFTGALTDEETGDVTQDFGGTTDLDTILTRAGESLGPDFEYQESEDATPRPYIEVIRGWSVSVKDFGAVGDGIADDTTPVQRAINERVRLGAGVLLWDPGTYKITAPLTLASSTGIEFLGRGQGASIISQATAATDALTGSTLTDFAMRNLAVVGPVVISDATRPVFDGLKVSGGTYGIDLGGTSNTDVRVLNCNLTGSTRAMRFTNVVRALCMGTQFTNLAASAIEYAGSTALVTVTGSVFAADVGVLFNSALTGKNFVIAECPTLGTNTSTASIDMTGLATLPDLRQWGNSVNASANTGASQTPVLYRGHEIICTAAAAAVTVNNPAILPGTASYDVGLEWTFVFKNAAGAAVTWTLGAAFVLDGGTPIPTTDGHTIMTRFRWDRTTSKLRECTGRSDTVT